MLFGPKITEYYITDVCEDGTKLIWQRVLHSTSYIVGHFENHRGLYTEPKLWKVTGDDGWKGGYITAKEFGRVYLRDRERNLAKNRKKR